MFSKIVNEFIDEYFPHPADFTKEDEGIRFFFAPEDKDLLGRWLRLFNTELTRERRDGRTMYSLWLSFKEMEKYVLDRR